MKPLPWLERTFDFSFNAGMFPAYMERVQGTPARLEEFISGIHPAILIKKPNGKWSIQEHAGHLVDLDDLHEGRLEDYKAGNEILRPADMKNLKTEDAGHNEKDIGEILKEFRNARQSFVSKILEFSDEELVQSALHERLGKQMRVVDLAFFVAEHDDHHMALMRYQLQNLK